MAPNNDNNAVPQPPPAHQQNAIDAEAVAAPQAQQYVPVIMHPHHPQPHHHINQPHGYYYPNAPIVEQPPPPPPPPVRRGNDPLLQEMLRMPYVPMYALDLPSDQDPAELWNRPHHGMYGAQLREFYAQQQQLRLAADEAHVSSTEHHQPTPPSQLADDGTVRAAGFSTSAACDPVSSTGIDAEEVVPPMADVSSSGVPAGADDDECSTAERCPQQVAEAIADILDDCPTAFTGIQDYLRERDAWEAAYEMDDAETETEDETSDWMHAEEQDEYI